MARRSLVLADDHELVARGLASLLTPHHEVAGIVHTGNDLLALLERDTPECVLLDISMPERNGLDVLPDLRRRWPNLKVLVVTMHLDRALADRVLSLGADGFVPKDAGVEDLLAAIETVFAGKKYMSPRVPKHTDRCGLAALHPALISLTPRQQQILFLISEDRSTAAIAKELALTESTVSFHRTNIRRKLGIDSEPGLYRFAQLMRDALAETKPEYQASQN
ncbi:MAG TPA: response regulator transcription factor [Gemmatimonadales bacterium]|nr:response regulator transcription factor [Gemmatimonadales bacterium]